MAVVIGKNGFIHLALILTTVVLAMQSLWFVLLYPAFSVFADILYYVFHIAIFDPEERIARGYEFASVYTDAAFGEGLDLGFNLYDGNYTKSRSQAQEDKWNLLIEQLQLKPGMKLIDVGCGYGDWINYAKSKGIEVVGVNISGAQVSVCHDRGLDVICSNWKTVLDNPQWREKLLGRFDAVTLMDTVEHFVPAKHRINRVEQNKIYTTMFQFTQQLLADDSDSKRVFISCLHARSNDNRTFSGMLRNYFLDKYHSGCYPVFEIDQLVVNGTGAGFELLQRWNKTMDYAKTSILDPEHFGIQKMEWNARRFLLLPYFTLFDPDWLHKWIYRYNTVWMTQFDVEKIEDSSMQLLWLLFRKG